MSEPGKVDAVPDQDLNRVDAVLTMRSDVRRNRRVLLQAARELLTARSDVPMYEIARLAGVGQATLYRHFPDRAALVAAVAEENLEALEARVASTVPPGPDALAEVLRLSAETVARSGALVQALLEETRAAMKDDPLPPQPGSLLGHLLERFAAMFGTPVQDAKDAGIIRPGFQVEDALFVLAMVKGAVDAAGPALDLRTAAAARAVDLAFDGILTQPSG
jgi:AcrR family transcriptional regulator